jgi:4'-phosphopantetheinyl transferase
MGPIEIRLMGNDLSLFSQDVHIWWAFLEDRPDLVLHSWKLLSTYERTTAERYVSALDRSRYVIARGTLRSILALYTDHEPAAIALRTSASGKPFLEPGSRSSADVQFNLSHSFELAVFAFARRPVGVDVEKLRPIGNTIQIAEHFLSQSEIEALKQVPESRRTEAFFRCWTLKEAYLKAKGVGLSMALSSFSVCTAGDCSVLVSSRTPIREVGGLTLMNISCVDTHLGALAVEEKEPRVIMRNWQG